MDCLQVPLTSLKGVGPKTGEKLSAAGLDTVEDLLRLYPRRYDALEAPISDISEAADGQVMAVRGFIEGKLTTSYAGRFKITNGKIRLVQAQGQPFGQLSGERSVQDFGRPGGEKPAQLLGVTWFNMPYLKNSLVPGKLYVFRGYVKYVGRYVRLSQPAIYEPETYAQLQKTLQPVYPTGGGVKEGTLRRLIALALSSAGEVTDFLPADVLGQVGLCTEDEALRGIHFPGSEEEMLRARARLVFDEFLLFILGIRSLKQNRERMLHSYELPLDAWVERTLRSLSFSLTGAQQRVWTQVEADMCARRVMARLIQGDVGSGKTVIAFLAMIKAVENGGQAALMVPTEVLAAQHFEAFEKLCAEVGLPIHACLLTGSVSVAAKRKMHEEIASGAVQVIIGTHALITEKVSYRHLVLAVTDEQHRFGVRQREMLSFKGEEPHVLVMSATPIPRTLAVILYGDLEVSVIDELPAGRIPIKNCVVDPTWRAKAYAFILREVRQGRQAYVICPMVEESEELEASNVTDYAETLRRALPREVRVEYLHGKMRPAEKNAIMERFAAGQIDVLVSTTVVEVGVNVPNATVMMVEDAQRFGLAQLHQLRGRVGRGDAQAYCILVNTATDGAASKRLEVMKNSNDGFEIAGMDLKMRGPGDLFGIRQSGLLDFRIGDVYADAGILQSACDMADRIIGEDAALSSEKYRGISEKLQCGAGNEASHIAI